MAMCQTTIEMGELKCFVFPKYYTAMSSVTWNTFCGCVFARRSPISRCLYVTRMKIRSTAIQDIGTSVINDLRLHEISRKARKYSLVAKLARSRTECRCLCQAEPIFGARTKHRTQTCPTGCACVCHGRL